MDNSENGRPAKKARIEGAESKSDSKSKSRGASKWRDQKMAYKRQQRRDELNHPQPESAEHRRDRELFGIDEDINEEIGLKPLQDRERAKLRKLHVPKMFNQPSVMASGDKGIFVTCDMGREKKSLNELADLVEDYLEKREIIPAELVDPNALLESRLERQQKKSGTIAVDNEDSPVEEEEIDIESSVNAELSGMRSPRHGDSGSHQSNSAPVNVRAFQLITLDIPCVSFLRFVPEGIAFDKVDVVDIVHSICAEAAKNPGRMRSRFIKRLSPIVGLEKVLSGGLEKVCEIVLPPVFEIKTSEKQIEENTTTDGEKNASSKRGVTFAVRPTIRNNSKVSRNEVIDKIAAEVQKLGKDQHKVDLTGYEKGILVEIYRGWIGMTVVDNTKAMTGETEGSKEKTGYGFGYEELKRFNLAEIYAEGISKGEKKEEKDG